MSKSFDNLNKTFNLPNQSSKLIPQNDYISSVEVMNNNDNDTDIEQTDLDSDYNFVRNKLRTLLDMSITSAEEIIEIASDNTSPRGYEVAGQLLKNSSEIAEKLIQLHKHRKDITSEEVSKVNVTNNSLFVGSSIELFKALKSKNIIEDNK